jgi:hypothetical protein
MGRLPAAVANRDGARGPSRAGTRPTPNPPAVAPNAFTLKVRVVFDRSALKLRIGTDRLARGLRVASNPPAAIGDWLVGPLIKGFRPGHGLTVPPTNSLVKTSKMIGNSS